jgi:hypothetical protein
MCSARLYNQINRQAGCPLELPPSQSSPAFLLPLAAVRGAMDRGSFVLILPLGLLVLEPVLVLLAVGHGGAFEGLGLLLQVFIVEDCSAVQVGVVPIGTAQVGFPCRSASIRSAPCRKDLRRLASDSWPVDISALYRMQRLSGYPT